MASIALALEGFIWKGLQAALHDPTTTEASIVTHYFHNMHAMARYQTGAEDKFHPIAACIMASIMALAACFFVRAIENGIPKSIRWEFALIGKGAPCVYAASIIATAAYHYTIATNGDPLNPPKTKDKEG